MKERGLERWSYAFALSYSMLIAAMKLKDACSLEGKL